MPALAPYIPNKDSLLDAWAENFSSLISASPGRYGLTAGDASTIAAAVGGFDSAYQVCTSPTTKTAAAVSTKNTQRTLMLATVRPYAQEVSNNPGVASADKVALGLNPKTSKPQPITAPASNPVLTLGGLSPGHAIIRYRDSAASVSVKAKPYGVTGCVLSVSASATAITDPTKLGSGPTLTKTPDNVDLSSLGSGVTVYLAARWVTQKQDFSPFSPIISFVLP